MSKRRVLTGVLSGLRGAGSAVGTGARYSARQGKQGLASLGESIGAGLRTAGAVEAKGTLRRRSAEKEMVRQLGKVKLSVVDPRAAAISDKARIRRAIQKRADMIKYTKTASRASKVLKGGALIATGSGGTMILQDRARSKAARRAAMARWGHRR